MINSQIDLDQILSSISSAFSMILDFDLGCVAIHDKSEGCLYIRHVYRRNGDNTAEGRYVPLEESNLVGWVAINRKPILRRNIRSDKRFREIMREDSLGSDIVVPLFAKGVFIGTLNFGSYEPDHYTEYDLRLVNDFSKLISIAIEKAQLLEELNELGEKFRNLMRSANDLIMMLDMSGDIVECNDAVVRILGYGKDEVNGRSLSDFAPPSGQGNREDELREDCTRRDHEGDRGSLRDQGGWGGLSGSQPEHREDQGTSLYHRGRA